MFFICHTPDINYKHPNTHTHAGLSLSLITRRDLCTGAITRRTSILHSATADAAGGKNLLPVTKLTSIAPLLSMLSTTLSIPWTPASSQLSAVISKHLSLLYVTHTESLHLLRLWHSGPESVHPSLKIQSRCWIVPCTHFGELLPRLLILIQFNHSIVAGKIDALDQWCLTRILDMIYAGTTTFPTVKCGA